ncbi:hypothetical protein Ahia01_000047400, partial [Argonauta hians]
MALSPFDKAKKYVDVGNPGFYSPAIRSLNVLDWQPSRTSPYDMWRWRQSDDSSLTRESTGRLRSYSFNKEADDYETTNFRLKVGCTVFCLFVFTFCITAAITVSVYFYQTSDAAPIPVDNDNLTVFICRLSMMENWNQSLTDRSSEIFKSTKNRFIRSMDDVYSERNEHYIGTEVVEFSPGSINVKFRILFNTSLDQIPMDNLTREVAFTAMKPLKKKGKRLQDRIVHYIRSSIIEANQLRINRTTVKILEIQSGSKILKLTNSHPLDRRKLDWKRMWEKMKESYENKTEKIQQTRNETVTPYSNDQSPRYDLFPETTLSMEKSTVEGGKINLEPNPHFTSPKQDVTTEPIFTLKQTLNPQINITLKSNIEIINSDNNSALEFNTNITEPTDSENKNLESQAGEISTTSEEIVKTTNSTDHTNTSSLVTRREPVNIGTEPTTQQSLTTTVEYMTSLRTEIENFITTTATEQTPAPSGCDEITYRPCRQYRYNWTRMDAQMNTYSQDQALSMMDQFLDTASRFQCTGSDIHHFTCSLFFPKCQHGRIIIPCAERCY